MLPPTRVTRTSHRGPTLTAVWSDIYATKPVALSPRHTGRVLGSLVATLVIPLVPCPSVLSLLRSHFCAAVPRWLLAAHAGHALRTTKHSQPLSRHPSFPSRTLLPPSPGPCRLPWPRLIHGLPLPPSLDPEPRLPKSPLMEKRPGFFAEAAGLLACMSSTRSIASFNFPATCV